MGRVFTGFTASNPLTRDAGKSTNDGVTMQTSPAPGYGTHCLCAGQQSTGALALYYGYLTVPSHTVGEYLAMVRLSSSVALGGIAIFGSSAYYEVSYNVSSDNLQSNLGAPVSSGVDLLINTWYWLRLRKNGTSVQVAVWADGSAEPAGDTLSQTLPSNYSITRAYFFGGTGYPPNGGFGYCGYLSAGYDGETAYRPYRKVDGYVRDGGVWKPADPLYVRQSGVWKDPVNWYARTGGVWKDFYG